ILAMGQNIFKRFKASTLLILDNADTLKRAEIRGDEDAMALVSLLKEFVLESNIPVKILATLQQPLRWQREKIIHLDGLDIDSGVKLLTRNLDAEVRQKMEKEKNNTQLLNDLVRHVDGHPLCLKSLARTIYLPQYEVHEHCSKLLT